MFFVAQRGMRGTSIELGKLSTYILFLGGITNNFVNYVFVSIYN